MCVFHTDPSSQYQISISIVPFSKTLNFPWKLKDTSKINLLEDIDAFMIQLPEKSRSPTLPTRLLILATGMLIGIVTVTPNVMLSEASTPAAYLGTVGSIVFALGGCLGGYYGLWKMLLPGLILQVLAFAVMGV